jgi:hypothetical protein
MDKIALELYLYMGSTEPIIKWLKDEGCKTKEDAINKLRPLVSSNISGFAMHAGKGASLAGTANGVEKILKTFKE